MSRSKDRAEEGNHLAADHAQILNLEKTAKSKNSRKIKTSRSTNSEFYHPYESRYFLKIICSDSSQKIIETQY